MSDSVRPHRRQPNRLPRPWDSPGKNTGVGCHFLLQCMKVKIESEVAQSRQALSDPVDRSLPGSSARGIFQARVYLSPFPLPFASLLFSDLCKASLENRLFFFFFLHFPFFGMVLVPTSYTMLQISVRSYSCILSTRSNPLILFVTSTVSS